MQTRRIGVNSKPRWRCTEAVTEAGPARRVLRCRVIREKALCMRLWSLLIVLPLSGCAVLTQQAPPPEQGRLDCTQAPRCASSSAEDAARRVPPLQLVDTQPGTWAAVPRVLTQMRRSTVMQVCGNYLHVEFRTPSGLYTDDVEMLRDPDSGEVQIRSAGRIGYYDFGANRERIAQLRLRLEAAGVIVPQAR